MPVYLIFLDTGRFDLEFAFTETGAKRLFSFHGASEVRVNAPSELRRGPGGRSPPDFFEN